MESFAHTIDFFSNNWQALFDWFGSFNVEDFIRDYGYWAVFAGSLIEGESIILLAGASAHEGYLSLWKVMVVAFLGSVTADQALFHLGRHYGNHFLDKHPKMKPAADRCFDLLRRWGDFYIIIFRFIYGIRFISPIMIGVAGINPRRYTILNLFAGVLWSVLSCSAGYYGAHMIHYVLAEFAHYSKVIFAVLIVLIAGGYGYTKYRHWKRKKLVEETTGEAP